MLPSNGSHLGPESFFFVFFYFKRERDAKPPGTIWHAPGREDGHGPGGMKAKKKKIYIYSLRVSQLSTCSEGISEDGENPIVVSSPFSLKKEEDF